jgi:hypothetical protein
MEERRKGREFFFYSNLEGEGSKIPKHQKDRQKEDTLPDQFWLVPATCYNNIVIHWI